MRTLLFPLFALLLTLTTSANINWPKFMARHDFVWEKIPTRWEEAPYLGNGNVGSQLYLDKKSGELRLQLFRIDIQDHRDNSHGWTAYSRPRLMLGSFYLKTVGKITGANWRMDLWNATLRGSIETDKGTLTFEHLVHTEDMAVLTKITTTGEESGHIWRWAPGPSKTTRKGYPRNEKEREKFIRIYGEIYRDTLKPFIPNPAVRLEKSGEINLAIQNLLAGGQYAVAWQDQKVAADTRRHIVSIEKSYPAATAAKTAAKTVARISSTEEAAWLKVHTDWWHNYYPASFFSIPDTRLESFYWHQMFKMACATREDRPMMDTAGPWIQPTPWPYITWDLNVQLCYWPTGPSNRLHLGRSLINVIEKNKQNLINNVRPKEWQVDSAYIPVVSAQDLIEPRNGDRRYFKCVGNLPWAMHNCWLLYRFSMDDEILRQTVYPMLKRSINLYRHLLIEGKDGKLHLPVTYSPEAGHAPDCNYDVALLKWGVQTLLWSAKRLGIEDPLIKDWEDIDKRLVDFPVDENGFMLGAGHPWNLSHRHYSHLLMAYPLYLVNQEQGPEEKALIKKSLEHWISFKGALKGYSYTGAASISAAIGEGNDSLKYLKGLERFLQPNGLYKEAGPVMETPLSAAQSMHDMVIQSWGETIRVFPAAPDAWQDIVFEDFRAEGAFLVSSRRAGGETKFVRVESLAGERCLVKPNFPKNAKAQCNANFQEVRPGVFLIHLKKGETATIWQGDGKNHLTGKPIPANPKLLNTFGLRN